MGKLAQSLGVDPLTARGYLKECGIKQMVQGVDEITTDAAPMPQITPVMVTGETGRGKRLVETLRGRATVQMTTDEIMALTRGEE